jgi:hypothetical protein
MGDCQTREVLQIEANLAWLHFIVLFLLSIACNTQRHQTFIRSRCKMSTLGLYRCFDSKLFVVCTAMFRHKWKRLLWMTQGSSLFGAANPQLHDRHADDLFSVWPWEGWKTV